MAAKWAYIGRGSLAAGDKTNLTVYLTDLLKAIPSPLLIELTGRCEHEKFDMVVWCVLKKYLHQIKIKSTNGSIII